MSPFRRVCALVLVLVSAWVFLEGLASAQQLDQLAAARILGPEWKQLSRAAGMVFAGTVLSTAAPPNTKDQAIPAVEVKFRVDRAIAGARQGEVLTIREWAGAWSRQRELRPGQRVLLFLYPPSRLGLTSPVGGPLGQLALSGKGEIVVPPAHVSVVSPKSALPVPPQPVPATAIRLGQLERAIRGARKE
jgi:cell division septation protein DedD